MSFADIIIGGFIALVVIGGLFIVGVWLSMVYSMLFENDTSKYMEYKYTEAILNNADPNKWEKK